MKHDSALAPHEAAGSAADGELYQPSKMAGSGAVAESTEGGATVKEPRVPQAEGSCSRSGPGFGPASTAGRKRGRKRGRKASVQPAGIQGARSLPSTLDDKVRRAEAAIGERLRNSPDAKPFQTPAIVSAPAGLHGLQRAPAFRDGPPVYAALDLGTNNCRLLVAVPTRPGRFRVVDAFSRIVRLGEGLSRTGSLASTAMDRAIEALQICRDKLSVREIAASRLIATEACRAAANGVEFLERVRHQTGLSLEIVSRETEARLAVSGCGSLVDRSAKGAVLFDIGGGSSEIALLDMRGNESRRLADHVVGWTSLPLGVVSLAEQFGGRDVSAAVFEAMVRHVSAKIESFPERHRLADIVGKPGFHLLGTSGTVTTLAGVQLGLQRYDRRQVDGLWLTEADVDRLIDTIAGWSFEERIANPCIGSERADLVLAGCAILQAIRRMWPARALRVADRGLREGLLTEMMVADGVWRRGDGGRERAEA